MPVGRYVRHTTPTLRQKLREKVLYAAGAIKEGAGAALAALGVSPVWTFAEDSDQYVYLDLKDPIDRVPGHPIRIKVVFAITTASLGDVAWYLDHVVVGEGEVVAGAVARAWDIVSAPNLNCQKTTDGFLIDADELDYYQEPGKSVDIQMQLGRDGTQAEDTNDGVANLLKVVAEYMAYV